MFTYARNSSLSAALVASIFSLNRRLPAWNGDPFMLIMISAPAARCIATGPDGYQMSSHIFTPTRAPSISYTGHESPARK